MSHTSAIVEPSQLSPAVTLSRLASVKASLLKARDRIEIVGLRRASISGSFRGPSALVYVCYQWASVAGGGERYTNWRVAYRSLTAYIEWPILQDAKRK